MLAQSPELKAHGKDLGISELDIKLPNSVFNTLKQHSYRVEKHSARQHEKKEHATHIKSTKEINVPYLDLGKGTP